MWNGAKKGYPTILQPCCEGLHLPKFTANYFFENASAHHLPIQVKLSYRVSIEDDVHEQ